MKNQSSLARRMMIPLCTLIAATAWAGTEGTYSTFYGNHAGESDTDDNHVNSFFGASAGAANTTGVHNTFIGQSAGAFHTTGGYNTFLGDIAGYSNTTGNYNTMLGWAAGHNNIVGSRNVFVGYAAGYSELGSNKLYIDNCVLNDSCATPLVYGEFDNHLLRLNAAMHVAANGAAKSQLHFSLDNTDVGGFLTSVLENNFFMSSGARYDQSAGGWVQRAASKNSVIQGSGDQGYRLFTSSNNTVGNSFTPTVRLHINYAGEFGINQVPVAGHEIHTSSGAYLAGGTWTNASSRELKNNIRALSADAAEKTLVTLVPVTFNYKSDAQQQRVGFIAEDVPELVAMKDRKGLSPMDIVAVLTKVLQEQDKLVHEQGKLLQEKSSSVDALTIAQARSELVGDALKQELSQLRAELAAIKAELASTKAR